MIMDTFRRISAWSNRAGLWPALVGSLILAGMTWLLPGLSIGHSGANANHSGAIADRPLAAQMRPAGEQSASGPVRHPLDDALEFVEPSLQALKNVEDYTAVITKTELIQGGLRTEQMEMKFRQNPFSVYLHGNAKRKEGREVIFAAGRNDGKLVAHEVGLKSIVGTMQLNPDDPKVMDVSRHPITEIGMAKMLDSAIEIWKDEKQTVDPANVDVRISRHVEVGGRECDAIEISHPRRQPGLTYQVGRIYVDCQSRLPVKSELYGWPANPGDKLPLLEEYSYANVKTNVGLSDRDFDPRNRAYRFNVGQGNQL